MYEELVKRLRYAASYDERIVIQDAKDAADAIEDLQKQLQKSEEDNVNLTEWLAEEHVNKCPHYLRNVHNRGDDSMCKKYLCEVKDREDLKLKQSFWIPVTERLPEERGHYLICVSGKAFDEPVDWVSIAYFYDKFYYECSEDITHWMPLPEPPKENIKW